MRRYKKVVFDIAETSFLAAGGALGLGAIGGSAATHGQQGLANATRFLSPTGSMAGAGAMLRNINKIYTPKKKRRKRR